MFFKHEIKILCANYTILLKDKKKTKNCAFWNEKLCFVLVRIYSHFRLDDIECASYKLLQRQKER